MSEQWAGRVIQSRWARHVARNASKFTGKPPGRRPLRKSRRNNSNNSRRISTVLATSADRSEKSARQFSADVGSAVSRSGLLLQISSSRCWVDTDPIASAEVRTRFNASSQGQKLHFIDHIETCSWRVHFNILFLQSLYSFIPLTTRNPHLSIDISLFTIRELFTC